MHIPLPVQLPNSGLLYQFLLWLLSDVEAHVAPVVVKDELLDLLQQLALELRAVSPDPTVLRGLAKKSSLIEHNIWTGSSSLSSAVGKFHGHVASALGFAAAAIACAAAAAADPKDIDSATEAASNTALVVEFAALAAGADGHAAYARERAYQMKKLRELTASP